MKKTYISTTGFQITFPVNIAGKVKFISLNGTKNDVTVLDEATQRAIEASKRFKRKEIELLSGEPFPVEEIKAEPVTEVDVADITEDAQGPENNTSETTSNESDANTELPEPENINPAQPAITENVQDIIKEIESAKNAPTEYPEIKTLQEAANLLRTKFGVPHQAARGAKAVENRCQELKIAFPNLKA